MHRLLYPWVYPMWIACFAGWAWWVMFAELTR
jgi:hypothetical protein